ncbi:MAG: hypothetical protein QM796_08920 [Chthoniobacteraceae bacterium]
MMYADSPGCSSTPSPLQSAAHYTRGGLAPVPGHEQTEHQRTQRLQAEIVALRAWAESHRFLGRKSVKPDDRGSEHVVQFNEETQRVFKQTRVDSHKGFGIALGSYSRGAMPSEYLDRLELNNRIFQDDVRLEYLIVESNHRLSIVTSQPFIRGQRFHTKGD